MLTGMFELSLQGNWVAVVFVTGCLVWTFATVATLVAGIINWWRD